MSNMNLKTLMLSGVLALGAQNVLASSPVPCPKGSPINDTIGVLQSDIKSNVHNRLMQIDREKFHQIVIITVNSPDEYGYDSLSRMGADTINKCGIGYRGENTGTIVWFSNNFDVDKNKYFISTASGVSGYITDNLARRLVASSKETCDKTNVSCRMDDITKGLDAIITKHLTSKEQVQVIQDGITAHDQKAASDSIENILQMLGLGGLVILVVGGGIKLQSKLTASKKRKELKKKILEVAVKFEQEKAKYPEWFVVSHIEKHEKSFKQIQNLSDTELDKISKSLSQFNQLKNIKLGTIVNIITSLKSQYEEIIQGVETTKKNLEETISQTRQLYSQLEKDGYDFAKHSLVIPTDKSNPEATLHSYTQMLSVLEKHIREISQIPQFYKSIQGLDVKVFQELGRLKSDFEPVTVKYVSIYGKSSLEFSFSNLENEVQTLITLYKTANEKKNLMALSIYQKQSETIFSGARSAISNMKNQIAWYEGLPREISALETRLKKYSPSAEYVKNAKAYKEESGKRKFEGYDMEGSISLCKSYFKEIKHRYSSKEGLVYINDLLVRINYELSLMEEYVGLGAIVAALIAQRIAEAEAARQRQVEAEEEAERQRRRDEDSRSSWSSSSSDSSGWSSGGGGGGDGGGGGGD